MLTSVTPSQSRSISVFLIWIMESLQHGLVPQPTDLPPEQVRAGLVDGQPAQPFTYANRSVGIYGDH